MVATGKRSPVSPDMRRTVLITLMGLLTAGAIAAEVRVLPKEAFWQAGFPWLADPEADESSRQPWEIPVYQLSCASCLESFAAILKGEEGPSKLFFFNTAKRSNRGVAQAMVAAALTHSELAAQGQVFRLLLGAFLKAPEEYLNDLEAWRALCQQHWADPMSSREIGPRADALNRLHEHNRLLGLLDVYMTPAWLSMDEESRQVPAEEDLEVEAWQFRLLMVAEPSLQPDLEAAGGDPVPIRQIDFDPGAARSAADWREIADEIEKGILWLWSVAEGTNSDVVKQWRARLHQLPDLDSRKDFFVRTFDSVATWKSRGEWSLIEYLSKHQP